MIEIQATKIINTNFSFPSTFEVVSNCGCVIQMSFRTGVLKIIDHTSKKLLEELSRDDFDISGFIELEELVLLLKKSTIVKIV